MSVVYTVPSGLKLNLIVVLRFDNLTGCFFCMIFFLGLFYNVVQPRLNRYIIKETYFQIIFLILKVLIKILMRIFH